MLISETTNNRTQQEAGAISANDNLNKVVGVGAGAVAVAYAGGAVINLAAGAAFGAVFYAGAATIAGAASYGCIADDGFNQIS